ncbi:MAG: hypothetical protein IT307_18660 [Chloroflexi bacterium]|nr:hypothetical protein [Chloroflexota bacterium]
MRILFSFTSFVILSALALVAPTDCPCPAALHRGELLHPVFPHVHAHLSLETDGLAARDQVELGIRGMPLPIEEAAEPIGSKLVPLFALPPTPPAAILGWLVPTLLMHPTSAESAPLDPPPQQQA